MTVAKGPAACASAAVLFPATHCTWVVEVGLGSTMPLRSSAIGFDVMAEGRRVRVREARPRAEFRTADPSYFRAAGIPLAAGREFTDADDRVSPRVVILNETLAETLFPGEDPIGQRVAWTGDGLRFTPISGEWRTVVGVVRNTRDGGPDTPARGVMFSPYAQELAIGGGFVIRADSNVADLAAAATRTVRSVVPGALIENVMTVTQFRRQLVSPRRLNAVLVSSFGILAVLIAAVGIAGVLAFSVSIRTNEIGIRMSLGADAGRVQRMILREGGILLGFGLLIGVTGAFFTARVMQGLLFGVAPDDPATFLGVCLLMTLVGIGACWIPAHHAARIDPSTTMHSV